MSGKGGKGGKVSTRARPTARKARWLTEGRSQGGKGGKAPTAEGSAVAVAARGPPTCSTRSLHRPRARARPPRRKGA